MPRIAVLPSAVADQIAAGEVVERPASVVKELVENAMDAGATTIEVAITDGGRAEIRVSDDGSGMERDDAVLALDRHATSKIHTAADLVGVRSFGFRGEALPAICSVAHVEILTSAGTGPATLVRAAGGQRLSVDDAARRRGTTVTVSRLFYNTPARQKFLRGTRSEWRAISDAIATLAVTRLGLRIVVTHDGREAVAWPAVSSLRARIASIWGASVADALVDVDDVSGPIRVAGLAQRPSDVGTAARRTLVLVNGRAIRDTGLVRAAEQAYRSTLTPGLRPSVVLDVTVPDDAVDVNVHPAKAEVRFRDRWAVEQAVQRAVRHALGSFDSASILAPRMWPGPPGAHDDMMAPSRSGVELLGPPAGYGDGDLFSAARATAVEMSPDASRLATEQISVPRLVQLRATYIMFEREDGVILIDQHSAHERVLFECFLAVLERGEMPSQRLLFPLTLHLAPPEADAFEANRDLFEGLGFEIEGFGGLTLVVHSVPFPHPRFDPERCLRETLASLSGDRLAATAPRHERLAATVACKAAIKAGETLTTAEMESLFRALSRTALPAHDVHGRSTIVYLPWDEVERRFGRR